MSQVHKKHKNHPQLHETEDHVFVTKHIVDEKEKNHEPKKSKKFFSRSHQKKSESSFLSRDQISENLTAIYQNQDGSLPDMKNFQKSRRVKIIQAFFRILMIGLLAVMLASGIIYFTNRNNNQTNDVVLSMGAEESVKIGQSVTFHIRYGNPQSVPISQAVITVRYPEGFVFEKSNIPSTNDAHDEWKLGVLQKNAEGTLDITGRVYGSLNEQQSLRAFMNYLPSNFSSEFQKVATFAYTIQQSPVQIHVTAPPNTSYGATIPVDVTVSHDPDFSFDSLSFVIEPQNGFVKKNSEPLSDQISDMVWTLNSQSSTATIKIQGSFLSQEPSATSSKPMVLKVIGYRTPQKTGNPIVLAETTYLPALVHTALEAKLVINGALADTMVKPGENINASLVLKNTGNSALKNIEVALTLEAPAMGRQSILDWAHIQDSKDGTITGKSLSDTRRQGIVTWNNRQIPELSSLAAGKEVRIDVVLPIKKDEADAEKYTSWNITATTEAKYEVDGEKSSVNSNAVNLLINSDVALEVRDEVSSDSTIHTVTWLLSNTYHPLRDIELSADVYGDVSFDESKLTVPAGTAAFDKTKKKMKWNIAQMPNGVDVYALQFTLTNNKPNPSQIQLTSKVKVKVVDTVTQKEIILAGDEVLANPPVSP